MADKSLFVGEWIREFSNDKPFAGLQVAAGLWLGGWNWYQWARKPDVTTTQVFGWMVVLTAYVVLVVWYHAQKVWKREHQLRVSADERFQPRPVVRIDFSTTLGSGETTSHGKRSSVTLVNNGDEDAVNVSVEPITFTEEIIKFPQIVPLVAKNGGIAQLQPDIHSLKRGVVDVGHSFEGAWMYEIAFYQAEMGGMEWLVNVNYSDLRGRAFQCENVLTMRRADRSMFARFSKVRFVKR